MWLRPQRVVDIVKVLREPAAGRLDEIVVAGARKRRLRRPARLRLERAAVFAQVEAAQRHAARLTKLRVEAVVVEAAAKAGQ
eukprot:5275814-Prymnesium_polylepis.1